MGTPPEWDPFSATGVIDCHLPGGTACLQAVKKRFSIVLPSNKTANLNASGSRHRVTERRPRDRVEKCDRGRPRLGGWRRDARAGPGPHTERSDAYRPPTRKSASATRAKTWTAKPQPTPSTKAPCRSTTPQRPPTGATGSRARMQSIDRVCLHPNLTVLADPPHDVCPPGDSPGSRPGSRPAYSPDTASFVWCCPDVTCSSPSRFGSVSPSHTHPAPHVLGEARQTDSTIITK